MPRAAAARRGHTLAAQKLPRNFQHVITPATFTRGLRDRQMIVCFHGGHYYQNAPPPTSPLDLSDVCGGNGRMKITRRDLVVATVSLSLAVAGLALAQSVGKPVMHSSFFNWADLKATPTKTGERRSVFDAPTPTLGNFECHITTLNPGESPHAPHRHADEEIMILKEGTLAAIQGDTTNTVNAGGIIFEASNELHGLINIGTNRATYFVIKYAPHDLVK